jgi:hypothetical protein
MTLVREMITDECRRAYSESADAESFLRFLRERGFSRILSMGILKELSGCSLSVAKALVHDSQTWSDKREEASRLYDRLEGVAEDLMSDDWDAGED